MKKKLTAILMSLTLTATMISTVAPTTVDAASSSVRINKGSANKVVTYRTDDKKTRYSTTIKINGCTKKSQIKKLKSSNKNIKVTACNGYIKAVYKDKAAKATITCTVKNKKLKTTLTVKKYNKPLEVTTCDHKWKHVDAIGHEEQVLISDEWSEPIYEIHEVCNGCGEDFGCNGNAAADAAILHITLDFYDDCDSYRSAQVLVDTIHHEAVYETIWVEDEPAYDVCTKCGEKKVTTCDHEWKHVDAIGHEEQVLISDAWSEPIYEMHQVCNGCGEDFGYGNAAANAAILHITLDFYDDCDTYRSAQVLVDTIHHEAVYETI